MREHFELDPELLYFNSANQSILPRAVREAITRYHLEYERNPSAGLASAWGRLWDVQQRLARFLNADPSDIFLRANVTAVLNVFLLGAPLPPGSEIVAGELEYGAIVNICRMRAQRDGLSLRILKMPATEVALRRLTPGALADLVVSQLGPKTRLLLLSHVLGGIGLVLPLREIARETRKRGVWLVVDGAYAPGAIPVALRDLEDVDFYGCSLYKWMLGPKGTAFGWVARRHQEILQPIAAGWTTYDTFGPFAAFGGGESGGLGSASRRFQEKFLMAGCHDFAPFRAIGDALAFWEEQGTERIRRRMAERQAFLERTITQRLGWRRLAAESDELRGPLVTFRLPDRLQPDGPRFARWALQTQRCQINTVELRGSWLVALSPHVYNTEVEIEELARRLGKCMSD